MPKIFPIFLQENPFQLTPAKRLMDRKKEQFNFEVGRLKKIVQDNETIQEEVSKNIEGVEE